MRWVFLVAGFAAGLAVGLAFSQREVPRAARPRPAVIVREVRVPGAAEDAAPHEEPRPPTPYLAAPVVEPTGDFSEKEAADNPGFGRIEVDFDGFDGERLATVERTTLSGAREADEETPRKPGAVATFDVVPEVCDVWWLVGPRRVGTRVRVVAGRIVRLHATDFSTAPIPHDLAVLGVHVGATWGDSLPFFDFEIDSDDDGLFWRTNAYGCANVTLRPGRVTVKVGDQLTSVTLVAGRETVLEISHGAEGDVYFDPPGAGGAARLNVRMVGRRHARTRSRYTKLGRDGYLYMKAGEYEIARSVGHDSSGGTVLGTVRVFAGRASVFRVVLPPGVLEITVELPEEHARETQHVFVTLRSVVRLRSGGATAGQVGYGVVYVDQVKAKREAFEGRHSYRVSIDGLHPGRYRVNCGTATETVEVGTSATSVVLRPPR